METSKLQVQGVTKTFHQGRQSLETLASIDLAVEVGEFVTVIGPSGCGKSTLFNIVACIETPDAGMIAIDGEADSARAGKTGYMPQQPLLLPWKTVEENVVLGLDVRRVPRKKALLDALTRLSCQVWLLDVWQEFHSSVLFITHDVREAILLSNRIYVLSARPARVLRVVDVPLPYPRQPEQLASAHAVQLEQELMALLLKEQLL